MPRCAWAGAAVRPVNLPAPVRYFSSPRKEECHPYTTARQSLADLGGHFRLFCCFVARLPLLSLRALRDNGWPGDVSYLYSGWVAAPGRTYSMPATFKFN